MKSSTASVLRDVPRDITRFDEVSECVQSWVRGDAITADVCNAVFNAIASDPRPETVTVATAVLPSVLRESVVEYLADFQRASPAEIMAIASSTGAGPRVVRATPAVIDAIERWFAHR